MSTQPSPNFAYLAHHDARLVALGTQAEQHFAADPTVTLFKLRQFGEALAQRAAAKVGLFVAPQEGQQQLIDRLFAGNAIGSVQRSLFHDLRRVGNAAVHECKGDHREALHQLRMARELAVWLVNFADFILTDFPSIAGLGALLEAKRARWRAPVASPTGRADYDDLNRVRVLETLSAPRHGGRKIRV